MGPMIRDLGHIRSHGCRDLLVYCDSGRCYHSTTINADHLPDETLIRSLGPKMVCTLCGMWEPMTIVDNQNSSKYSRCSHSVTSD
jgi:hypothetical protein